MKSNKTLAMLWLHRKKVAAFLALCAAGIWGAVG